MAVKYARTAGGNWNADATWSTSSGGAADTTVPTAADDVILDSNSGNVTINAAAVCRSIDMTSGTGNYAGVLNHDAGITLTIGDATAGAGNVALKFTGTTTYTIDNGTTSSIRFYSSSATEQTVDFSGMNTGNVTFGSSSFLGKHKLTGAWGTDTVNASQITWLENGNLDTNGQTCYWGKFYAAYAYNRVLTFGSSTIYLFYGAGSYALYVVTPNMTLSAASATFIFAATSYSGSEHALFAGTWGTFQINGAGLFEIRLNGAASLTNLYRTGTAVKTDSLRLYYTAYTLTVTGEFKVIGNSAVNRMLVYSSTLGSPHALTLTGATISNCQNVDFQDITFTGSPDFSDIAGGSGDCGGNTGATFTASDDWYWHNPDATTPKNFSDNTMWYTATDGGGTRMDSDARETGNCKALLPQDNAYFDSNSMTHGNIHVDQDLPRMCKNLDFTGCGTITFDCSNLSNQWLYGSLILETTVAGTGGNAYLTFSGRGGGTFDLKDAGTFFFDWGGSIYVNTFGSTLRLTANFIGKETTRPFAVISGTFDMNGYNLRWGFLTVDNGATAYLRSGILRCAAYNGYLNLLVNSVVDCGTSTIYLTNTGGLVTNTANNKVFNNVVIESTTGNTPQCWSGSNTFNTLTINGPKTVKFTKGTTTTVRKLVVNAPGRSKQVVFDTVDGLGTFTLKTTSGRQDIDGVTLSRCVVKGGPWYAGKRSFLKQNNFGWRRTGFQPWSSAVTARRRHMMMGHVF